VRPDDLAAHVVRAALERSSQLDPASIDDVYFGDANGAGEDNRNVARMAVLLAGLPASVPGATVNRLCGSGMEAVVDAARAIAVGDASICIAGGVESMSRAPLVLPRPGEPFGRENSTLYSTAIGWRMVNPAMHDERTIALGEGAELLADLYGLTRDEQDRFTLRSHERAAATWAGGAFDVEVSTVPGTNLVVDECVRTDTSLERLSRLRPSFRPDGTVTAGNSSPLSDGAACLLLASEEGAARAGRDPLARIAGRAVSAVEPALYGIGPVGAAEVALKRAGVKWSDLVVVELNEAFAAQSLACLREWRELDAEIVNPCGGAIALGHPLGCSGARLLATLAWQLHRNGGGYGLAAMCIGVGQGIAVVLEA
jgi:acetyl-CoA acyltransferase